MFGLKRRAQIMRAGCSASASCPSPFLWSLCGTVGQVVEVEGRHGLAQLVGERVPQPVRVNQLHDAALAAWRLSMSLT